MDFSHISFSLFEWLLLKNYCVAGRIVFGESQGKRGMICRKNKNFTWYPRASGDRLTFEEL